VASTTYLSSGRRKPRRQRRTRWPLWAVLAIAFGALLVLLAGAAFGAIILHGRGELRAAAMQERDLQVSDVRLSRPLMPGGAADLLLSVRNLNAFGARVDQVTLVGALRKAKPAGCTSKVSGPVTRPGGYRLPLADQVLVGAGVKKDVVVHTAFTLAGSAKAGCGFTVEVDVSATQLTPIASPTTVNPTTAPTGTTPPHHSLPPTDAPTLTPATSQATPPPAATSDCDPADPTCVVALDPDPLRAVG
jgi:hypothetical protein